jgi:hypothetical protein
MVFIAYSNVEGIDTMKGKLMLAWYRNALTKLLWSNPKPAIPKKFFRKIVRFF